MLSTPTLSGPAASDLDKIVSTWVRSTLAARPGWTEYTEGRGRVKTMRAQLALYEYVQHARDTFAGAPTPPDLEGAGSVLATDAHVLKALGQNADWGQMCSETLSLMKLYGPGGSRGELEEVMEMLDAEAPVAIKFQAEKFLARLRAVHGELEAAQSA